MIDLNKHLQFEPPNILGTIIENRTFQNRIVYCERYNNCTRESLMAKIWRYG